MTEPLVLPLDDPRTTELRAVGGKAATLARLVDAGFPVPDGFCVTTTAYRHLIGLDADGTAVDDVDRAVDELATLDPAATDQVSSTSAAVRAAIQDRPIPDGVRRQVRDALDRLDGDSYAVRSSATAEDLPTASFAGQHETYLGVGADDVLDRIRDCMASLFTDRAVTYRLRSGVPHDEVALAVVVQEMVSPDVAGVLFTADPLTGNRRVASVDASYGLGEALVSGAVTADNARVDRASGEVLEYDVGDKAVAVEQRGTDASRRAASGADASGPDESGTAEVAVPPERRTARALTDDQLRTLVDLGSRVESLLSSPQDIEWALVEDEFVVLQSRPITSLFPLPEPGPSPTDDRLHVYFSFSHAQAMPEAMPPLVVDLWRTFLNDGFSVVSAQARAGRFAVAAGGRVYFDLTPLLQFAPLRRRLPGRVEVANEPAADGLRALLDRRSDALARTTGFPAVRTLIDTFRGVAPGLARHLPGAIRRFLRAFLSGPPAPEREREWVEAWGRQVAAQIHTPDADEADADQAGADQAEADLPHVDQVAADGADDAAARARAAFDRHDFSTVLPGVIPRIGPLLVAAVLAKKALDRLFPAAEDDLDAIGKGFEAEVVTAMNQRLGDLADTARDHPAVAAALRETPTRAAVEGVEGGDVFLAELDAFLDAFGHRAAGEIDVSRPRWRDDPSGLLQTVRGNLLGDDAGTHRRHFDDLERRAETAVDRLETRAATGPLGPLRVRLVRRLIRTYRGGIQLREHPKQGIGYLFAAWHDVLADAGETLAADGRLDDPDDVWFLRRDELFAALERGTAPTDDVDLDFDVDARRREHERYASMTAPPLVTSEGEDPTALVTHDVPPGTLVGTPVSAGVVEGVARVVRDPATTEVGPGEIIVAPSCDPGWTPLFLNAAGLVTEVGGRMTHGALVAREYGLPAVVSVRDATTEIRTGDRLRVDGTSGTVELLRES